MNIRSVIKGLAACTCLIAGRGIDAQQKIAERTIHAGVEEERLAGEALLARPVTINVSGVSIKGALTSAARSANVLVQFQSQVVDAYPKVITLHLSNVPLGSALERILENTRLRVVTDGATQLTIVETQSPASLRSGGISGTVIDATTKRPIRGATVTLDGATRGVTTDDRGVFHVTGLAAGTHTVAVKQLGYTREVRRVTVEDGGTVSLPITLSISPSVLDQVVVTGTVVATERKAIPNAMTVITAKDIEQRGITQITQLFRGEVPGLFAVEQGAMSPVGETYMFSRGVARLPGLLGDVYDLADAIKTYVDGVELANPKFLNQIDPKSIERIEIIPGPQASTIYGANAINGVMQIFTKRGSGTVRPVVGVNSSHGFTQNNFNGSLAPSHQVDASLAGTEGRISYNLGTGWGYSGAWTPINHSQTTSLYAGTSIPLRMLSLELSARQGWTKNVTGGQFDQVNTELAQQGILRSTVLRRFSASRYNVSSRTFSANVRATPVSWWSHQATVGYDETHANQKGSEPSFSTPSAYVAKLFIDTAHPGTPHRDAQPHVWW
jgi:hypothetical protein